MRIIIELHGLENLQRKLDSAFTAPIRDALRRSVEAIRKEVRVRTPVDTGALRDSFTAKIDPSTRPMWGEVRSSLPYSRPVEFGTRPHYPPVHALTGWASRRGVNPYALQRAIGKRGTKGAFMVRDGVRTAVSHVRAAFEHAARVIEQRWGE